MAKNKTQPKRICEKCKKSLAETSFYKCDYSPLFPDGRFHICNNCLSDLMEKEDGYYIALMALHAMNKPMLMDLWNGSSRPRDYFRQINSLGQYKGMNWSNSDFNGNGNPNKQKEVIESSKFDSRDKTDVLKMIGYDPFEHESQEDKPRLYSMLVNFLDDSTLEDGFKLQAVVEIVTGFNQIEKINWAITNITNDPQKMSSNSGGVKTLVQTKKDILNSLVKLAEENGISVKHNNQKSKGAGTLSGIIKTLHEKGVDEGEVNLFDIETAKGMSQVADISNESIIKQLQFDENDYTEMLVEQRDLIQELEKKSKNLEEENRLLKKENATNVKATNAE
mgnify:CR=1 FL=1